MPITGYVDIVTRDAIIGWAWDSERPAEAVVVAISIDGQVVGRLVANEHRDDLVEAGIGDGRHAFAFDATSLRFPLAQTVVALQAEATGEHLPRSPWQLEAPQVLTEPVRRAIAALLESPGSEAELRDRADFLALHIEGLLQRRADRQSRRAARVALRNRKWRTGAEEPAAPAPLPPRALVIDTTLPAPGRDAGANAIVSHMRSLQRLGFEVTCVPADVAPGTAQDTLAAFGIATACTPWTGSVEEVLRRQSGTWDLVYLHRVEVASCYMNLVRQHAPKARVICSIADLQSLRLFRQAAIEDRPELVPYGNHIRNQEFAVAVASHAVVSHSPAEVAMLREWLPHVNSLSVPWVFPLQPTPAPFEARHGVAFIGSFGHPPNLDAAIWLMDEIMPIVWETDPTVECFIAGTAMPEIVARPRDPRIRALGRVEDLGALLDSVRATVAPLAYGAGLKGKVGDSLAAGVPCVCTPVAAEGYALPPPLADRIAADAAGLARSILEVHGNREVFEACRLVGLGYVAQAFSETAVDSAMREAAGLPAASPIASTARINAVLAS